MRLHRVSHLAGQYAYPWSLSRIVHLAVGHEGIGCQIRFHLHSHEKFVETLYLMLAPLCKIN